MASPTWQAARPAAQRESPFSRAAAARGLRRDLGAGSDRRALTLPPGQAAAPHARPLPLHVLSEAVIGNISGFMDYQRALALAGSSRTHHRAVTRHTSQPLLGNLFAARSIKHPGERELATQAAREELRNDQARRQELEASRVRSEQTMRQRVHELGLELRAESPQALHVAARLWADLGHHAEALRVIECHVASQPQDALAHLTLAGILMEAAEPVRDFERALKAAREACRLHSEPEPGPALPKIKLAIAQALLLQGQPELAFAELPGEPAFRLPMVAMINWTLHLDPARFDADIAEAIRLGCGVSPAFIAQAYAWRGDVKEAFEWIDAAVQGNGAGLNDLTRSPFAHALKGGAKRWHDLLYRFNRLPDQLAAIARLMPGPIGA